ncbi:MAG: YIP1 family protein [Acidobacteriota bacterium]|jgi:hypothetical protein|nr:YIP1 family protein [Acidobacteriota bacterium]
MNEENNIIEEENDKWQAPPPPEKIEVEAKEPPQMSEPATLLNIFIEPGKTFEDLRRKPRFIMAGLIILILATGYFFALQQKIGEENIRRETMQQLEKNSQFASLTPEQKKQSINMQMNIQKYSGFAFPIILIIMFLLGGLFYWLGVKVMGGSAGYLQGLSVYIYSWLPPAVVASIANFIILFLKSPDEINFISGQKGLIRANPTMFFDGKDSPVLTTLLSTIDLFAIWGLILAAIGLHIVGKISKGAAWAIVLIITLIGITWRVVQAYLSGVPV